MKIFRNLFLGFFIAGVVLLSILLVAPGFLLFQAQPPQEAEIIHTTHLSNTKITFYHNPSLISNETVYFEDSKGFQYTALSPYLKIPETSTLIYVDFNSNDLLLTEDDMIIYPVDQFEVQFEMIAYSISVYQLDLYEEYWLIDKNREELEVHTCISSATNRSNVCYLAPDLDPNELLTMIESWQSIPREECPVDHTEMPQIASFHFNKHSLYEGVHYMGIKQITMDGTMYIACETTHATYYQLTSTQASELEHYFQ